MELENDRCLKCGQSISFMERIWEDLPTVSIPGKGELCPVCYRSLTAEEEQSYFA
ncbi:hypothetical protein RDV78_08845 [Bacillota bacterium LX-D]|nr:hypothetical protein [Bacillota bacterium LX-D]